MASIRPHGALQGQPRGRRRRGGLAAAALSVGLVAAACSSSSSPQGTGPSRAAGTSGGATPSGPTGSGAAATGGTVVDVLATVSPGVDLDDVGGATNSPIPQAYNTLVNNVTSVGDQGVRNIDYASFQPQLAESYTNDGTTYTFKLKHGVMSCAKHELTAADVVYTISRIKSVSGPSGASFSALNVANVFDPTLAAKTATTEMKMLAGEAVAVDQYTVAIKVKADNGLLLNALASPLVGIVDSVEAKAHATPDDPWSHTWMHTHTLGYGPYCLSSFTSGSAATLDANPGYTVKKPFFQKVQMKAIPQSSNRLAALQKGEAQIAEGLAPAEYAQAASGATTKTLTTFGTLNLQLSMSYKVAPWGPNGSPQATKLRQAVAAAIPYDQIIKDAYGGAAKKADNVIPFTVGGGKSYPDAFVTDPAKASSLLTDAGYPGGKGLPSEGLQLLFPSESAATLQPVAIRIQTALAAIGMKITLNPIPQAQLASRVFVKSDAPMVLNIGGSGILDATYYTQLWFLPPSAGGTIGIGGYDDPAVNALYKQAADKKGDARNTPIGQAQDIMVKDLPIVPVVLLPLQAAVSKDLTGVQVGGFGMDYAVISKT